MPSNQGLLNPFNLPLEVELPAQGFIELVERWVRPGVKKPMPVLAFDEISDGIERVRQECAKSLHEKLCLHNKTYVFLTIEQQNELDALHNTIFPILKRLWPERVVSHAVPERIHWPQKLQMTTTAVVKLLAEWQGRADYILKATPNAVPLIRWNNNTMVCDLKCYFMILTYLECQAVLLRITLSELERHPLLTEWKSGT